ncbi:copper amine oxidase N-terminal domain-containing protein [Paenibacillus sp. HJL G12]|uniref:Copper amine oxidase N-terminal domain-containing protein n=1 Tax=Paenibacillus dendrobii TaxID=2691084 RepID=A0A7X3IKF0_9BACL|nr:copper amine oxidase N-terminal domain-containing protein [Paenibacillus dendrobii]MWV45071.1 copper amine oxidase N-terminal domain-containing protein [Paenibacillus dendrobii]
MNFKKLTMIAVLAAAQTALVIPAAGAEGMSVVQPETVQGINATTTDSTVNTSTTQSGGTAGFAGNSTDGVAKNGATEDNQNTTGGTNGDNGTTSTDNSGKENGNTTTGTTTPPTGDQGTTNGTDTTGDGSEAGGENGQTETTPGTTTDTGSTTGTVTATTYTQAGSDQLILMMNSNKMYHNGKLYLAGQPMAVKNGVSYVAIRAMVERAGLNLTYDNKTKETIINKDGNELRFKTNSSVYRVNGVSKSMKGPAYQSKNVFMVPLTSITQALNIPYTVDQANKRVILSLSTKPVAAFTVQPNEIFVGETNVTYTTQSKTSNGLQIVNERWEGKQDIFQEAGTHTITHYVQDSSGQWSDPYTVTVNVLKPNEPPVANFTTDKDEYKMGEPVTITDLSTDDENAIVDRQWLNDRKAFFTPGPVTIRLIVTDKHGAVGEFQKTINITNETLYTEEDFNKLFTPVGDKYTFEGGKVPTWQSVPFTLGSEPATLIRSNSPETVYSEGLLYKETALGNTRFMIHHVNSAGKNMKLYVIATNTYTDTPAQITISNFGMGGPNPYPELTGKVSVDRYFQSIQNPSDNQVINLAPGESKVIMTDINKIKMKQGDTISANADAFSDLPIQYSVVLVDENKDPLQSLPYLTNLERDVHNRGTYPDSVRLIRYDEPVGSSPVRLVLGDNNQDPNLKGLDGIYGTEVSNAGNFGVLYKITLSRVAPHTLITLNPRGGLYSGVVTVNGQVVQVAKNTSVSAPNEASVLYRTGDFEQNVEIMYTPSPGSNLPINLLLMPLPQQK